MSNKEFKPAREINRKVRAGPIGGRLKSPVNRLRVVLPWLTSWPEWLSLLLLFLTIACAVYSLEQAKWTNPQPSLILTVFLAVLATYALIKFRLPDIARHFIIILLGFGITGWQLATLLGLKSFSKIVEVKPNEGTIYFTIFILLATFIISYVSTWYLVRKHNPWVGISLGAILLVINLSNLPKDYYRYFPVYILLAVLLVGQVNIAKLQVLLRQHGRRYFNRSILYSGSAILCLGILFSGIAAVSPDLKIKQPGPTINARISWKNADRFWLNVFAAVPGKWDLLRSDKQNQFSFSDPISQSEAIRFVVNTNKTDYWRTRRYDTYFSWGWSSNTTSDTMVFPARKSYGELTNNKEPTYTVTNKLKTDVLLTPGEFKTSSLTVLLQTLEHQPAGDQSTNSTQDIISVVTPGILQPQETYTITVSLNSATQDELSRAGTNYDKTIAGHYLQIPDTLPKRVKDLSRSLTENTNDAFGKVVAIQKFLEQFKYTKAVAPPPKGTDAVDYFLFEKGEGNCAYFASSVVVLLRSAGVPARLSSGYLLDKTDNRTGQFVLRAKDYHTRAEVYYPKYGWIEYETVPQLAPGIGIASTVSDVSVAEVTADGTDIWPEDPLDGPSAAGYVSYQERNNYLSLVGLISLIIIIVAATLLLLYQSWLKRVRRSGDASQVYAKMCFLAALGRFGPQTIETPYEYGARLAFALPEQSETIGNITHIYAQTRFSPMKDLDTMERTRLDKSWVHLYPALVKYLLRLRRNHNLPVNGK